MPAPAPAPGEEPWLVVIDLQRIFAEPWSPWASPGFEGALARSRELVAAHAPRVVFTRFVPGAEQEGSWVDYYRAWPFALEAGTAAAYDLVVEAGDAPVVTRPTMGKYGAELLAATGGSRRLVLCGVSTECCVLSTALAAADDGAWVQVVGDACAGASVQDHERSLAAMEAYAPQITVTR